MVESCRYFVGKTERRIKKQCVQKKPEKKKKTRTKNQQTTHHQYGEKNNTQRTEEKKHRKKKIFFLHELCIFSTTTMYYYNFYYYYYHITLFGLQTICIPLHSVGFSLRFGSTPKLGSTQVRIRSGPHLPHLQSFLPKKRATLLKPKLIHCDYTISLHPP